MKNYILYMLLLIITQQLHAQKNKPMGYAAIGVQGGVYKDGSSYGAGVQVGSLIDSIVGIGFGAEVLKLKIVRGLYLPFYGDLRIFFPSKNET
ncbi:MAG TPA: hypothetical protein VF622_09360, partial [Segetibacter sp.]